MMYFIRVGKLAIKVLFILIVLSVPGTLVAQQYRIEGSAGFNLFSLSDPILKAKVDSTFDMESDLTFDTMFMVGVYGGYDIGNLEMGAEFFFTSSGGKTTDIILDGITLTDSAGKFDYGFFKIGPVVRYYFESSNPEILPFAGGALDYVSATVEVRDPSLKFKQGYISVGIFGGANYYIQDNLYIGGMARIDYYTTISDDSIPNVDFGIGTGDVSKITTSGWTPLSVFFVIGTKL